MDCDDKLFVWNIFKGNDFMIEMKNISLKYDGKNILENINISFQKGSITLITGNSGSGKSSLLKLINGIIPEITEADITGDIIRKEESILEKSITQRSFFVSTVFQNPKTQFFTTQAIDELAFALENRNIPRKEIIERIESYTEFLKTKDLLGKEISGLSGGQKQMLAITSVACLDQEVYLFDEPSSSLDKDSIERVKTVCQFLKEKGKIVIIAEHRLYYLKEILDQAVVLENGSACVYGKEEFNEGFIEKHHLRTLKDISKEELKMLDFERRDLFERKLVPEDFLKCIRYQCRFHRDRPLFQMDISFSKGIHFIIGENGVGKTSFFKALCGVYKSLGQKTFYKGERIKREGAAISLVMQDVNYQLFTESVWDEISLVCEEEKKKEDILLEVGLFDKRDHHPQTLSGEEKQRLAFALCLASSKEIVLMDEPTSGLCRKSMERIISLIHRMEKEGKTIIIITHDYEFILKCGGKVLEFYNGKVKSL